MWEVFFIHCILYHTAHLPSLFHEQAESAKSLSKYKKNVRQCSAASSRAAERLPVMPCCALKAHIVLVYGCVWFRCIAGRSSLWGFETLPATTTAELELHVLTRGIKLWPLSKGKVRIPNAPSQKASCQLLSQTVLTQLGGTPAEIPPAIFTI